MGSSFRIFPLFLVNDSRYTPENSMHLTAVR